MSNYIERYWRDAKPKDAIKEPPMVSRFKLSKGGVWFYGKLYGIDRTRGLFFVCGQCVTPFCQVYDASDPGEGWRLIDPDKEKPRIGDEVFSRGQWIKRSPPEIIAFGNGIYRRRITPTVTYVPFTWEDREQLRGRWITWKHENGLMIESQIDHINQHRDGGLWFKSHDAKWLLENATFVDTGNPVGKEVVQ